MQVPQIGPMKTLSISISLNISDNLTFLWKGMGTKAIVQVVKCYAVWLPKNFIIFVTSLKGHFFKIEISLINKLSIDVWFVMTIFGWDTTIWKSGIWGCKKNKKKLREKITFKVVQINFLAVHITNQKLSFDIFIVGNLRNIFMEHDLYLIS